ncbi:mycothiol biosynthesis acetyltransferase [Beutenbergia cavernae DSM 12333]|uniref:Mycothiol acetyltransferase n=1 Tax=Beutenbergia cavernae (strain ATCC BAA-8 / DSM 12333 / CCUG 43141 / JCM 11478 / NBRC 16432 / NCIMB 13614 / HKI 0122) TaxID=471853 RepID=MSHD_BEUC1|nr:mycothiol synthase [Beutenbergia cavernae]C5C246.1 RecName: Full=Mycothiol acetyltransferase; Short=MSH acetyltransferase; AltName: Full=Mycothiol synthase [Beutenbergia cavernae DSM 12333]ACQ81671.1 mycothiol biosynthesis acetyltransferase [Beutenbergia cavernae DSM 12333]
MQAYDDEIVGTALASNVLALADRVRTADGVEALSEQHRLALEHPGLRAHHLVVTDPAGAVVGYASVLGSSVEMLVDAAHRGEGVGHRLAEAALAVEPTLAFWAHGDLPGAAQLAEAIGLRRVRELWHLGRDLAPAGAGGDEAALLATPLPGGERLRTFGGTEAEEHAWLALNARAFASHPEQGAMTLEDLRVREGETWFDPSLLWLVHDDGDGALLASMWLKVPDAATGEIYVLGVDPGAQGRGLGRALTDRALDVLRARGVDRVELYVEGENARARALYEHSGFTPVAVHAQYGIP